MEKEIVTRESCFSFRPQFTDVLHVDYEYYGHAEYAGGKGLDSAFP